MTTKDFPQSKDPTLTKDPSQNHQRIKTSTSPPIVQIRTKCLESLQKLDGEGKYTNYLEELEFRIFEWANKPTTIQQLTGMYYMKYAQLVYNLKQDLCHLISTYSPPQLVVIDSSSLNRQVKLELENEKLQAELYKKIQSDETDEGGSIVCRKCKQTRIVIVPRQLKSGDEPMSLFHICSSCGFQWRVG